MGIALYWFKDYKISEYKDVYFNGYYDFQLIECNSTSHSSGNVRLVQDLFFSVTNKAFPMIPGCSFINSTDFCSDLIKPNDMLKYCNEILKNPIVDLLNLRSRFEWFKKYSEEGYYIAYEYL